MSNKEDLAKLAPVFNSLGNDVRLRILQMVISTDRPLHIKAVARSLKKDYSAVYRHVKVLEASGLLKIHEVGRSRVLAITDNQLLAGLLEGAQSFMSKKTN